MQFKSPPRIVMNAAFSVLLLITVIPVLYRDLPSRAWPDFVLDNGMALNKSMSNMSMGFACEDCLVPSVHGANVIETHNGGLLATWFGGSREGAKDVVLWGADFSPQTQHWSTPRKIIGPAETQATLGRHIKTVGNSVLVRELPDALLLYYVTVSVGGWAGSSLNVIQSLDDGKTWTEPKRLITSPFANISTLNKSSPVHFSDGSIGLPVYHEFIGKFSEMLRIDRNGRILDKSRITYGRHSIQPLLIPYAPQSALALMRDTGPAPGQIRISRSEDAGMYWSSDKKSSLPNPDSAVAGLRRPDGSLLLIFNDIEVGRNSLALAVSRDDGNSWKTVRHFEQSRTSEEFSYPYLIRSSNGSMHLLYTWNRKRIRHVVFNDNWVDGGTP